MKKLPFGRKNVLGCLEFTYGAGFGGQKSRHYYAFMDKVEVEERRKTNGH